MHLVSALRGVVAGSLLLAGAVLPTAVACDPDNGGIRLPPGFCATVFADEVGQARRIAVAANGTVYVANRDRRASQGIIALRDDDGDGRADQRAGFGPAGGAALQIYRNWIYYGLDDRIVRYPLPRGDALVPEAGAEVIVSGFPLQRAHALKTFSFDDRGNLYVNVGAPSNACQAQTRQPGSPGLDPCPQRERQAGIWRFDAMRPGQTQAGDGERYATGIRNAVANTWHEPSGQLFVVQHGRDQLAELWPALFTAQERRDRPAEELFAVSAGDDFGWPYCYFDPIAGRKVLAPEYGGDGRRVGRCAAAEGPVVAFPAHWAPNDIVFYQATQFPARWRGGAFVAFHGSWNRQPFDQAGFKVAFVPVAEGGAVLASRYETFADGFVGAAPVSSPDQARYRPAGLAVGPDGALFVSEDQTGRVWRVRYAGTTRSADARRAAGGRPGGRPGAAGDGAR